MLKVVRFLSRGLAWPRLLLVGIATFNFGAALAAPSDPVSVDTYARAERLLPSNVPNLVYDIDVRPTWIPGSDQVWYKTTNANGSRFMIAEPLLKRSRPAFDAERMAEALTKVTGKPVTAGALPISDLSFPKGPAGPPRVTVAGKAYDCDLAVPVCAPDLTPSRDPQRAYGPDGRFSVFAKGPNLWVQDLKTRAERALTTDGAPNRAYGAAAEGFGYVSRTRAGLIIPPTGDFSPDGSKFATYQLDESGLPLTQILQIMPDDGGDRPKLWSYHKAGPSDEPATGSLVIFDLVAGTMVKIDHPPSPVGLTAPMALERTAWSADSRDYYFVDYSRDLLRKTLYRADAATGAATSLIDDLATTDQQSVYRPGFRLLTSGQILWPSERSGYEQLYLHGADGRLVRRLTKGDWVVRDILKVDEKAGVVYLTGSGRNPREDAYLRHLYAVGLDGRAIRDLTPEAADHEIVSVQPELFARSNRTYGGFSDDGLYFVDASSRVDMPTTTVIRDQGGKVVMTLSTASLTEAAQGFYRQPEPFQTLAADGKTPIYGIMLKPSNFDPSKRYPVIDAMYDGPQSPIVLKRYLSDVQSVHAGHYLAELGFVVIQLDGRGKIGRSRAFFDYGYGNLGRGGLDDHVAAIEQLAASRPYMDTTRVGAFGYSGGGFATVHALMDHPDVFKVGVAISPYTLMFSDWSWTQAWQGPYDRARDMAQEPWVNASNFKGKLFIAIGDADDVVHPGSLTRIADALIKQDKPFDMLVVPGGDHRMILMPYVQGRIWDYFVRNLQGAEPPANYVIGASTSAH